MDIGLMHLSPSSKADPAVVAKHAETLGFESYWVGDHTIIPVESSVRYPGTRPGQAELAGPAPANTPRLVPLRSRRAAAATPQSRPA